MNDNHRLYNEVVQTKLYGTNTDFFSSIELTLVLWFLPNTIHRTEWYFEIKYFNIISQN